jgi:uroporphyrinogen decarboxylase
MLVGMEDLMCYFYSEPEAVHEICERIMDFQLGIAEHYLKIGIEIVYLSDDLGSQSGLMLSPDIIEQFLLPQYRRLFDLYKTNNILVNFHSCGQITSALEYFLDLGVDILNPVQATANALDEVRQTTNGRIALMGAVNSGLIMSGPADAIRKEVRQRIFQLGKEGGYFCSPDQFMPYPKDNLSVLHDAIDEFGRYPLREA